MPASSSLSGSWISFSSIDWSARLPHLNNDFTNFSHFVSDQLFNLSHVSCSSCHQGVCSKYPTTHFTCFHTVLKEIHILLFLVSQIVSRSSILSSPIIMITNIFFSSEIRLYRNYLLFYFKSLHKWPLRGRDELIKESLQQIIPFERLSIKLFSSC